MGILNWWSSLVNFNIERDSGKLTNNVTPCEWSVSNFLKKQLMFSYPRLSNYRSVMPLDVQAHICWLIFSQSWQPGFHSMPTGVGNLFDPIHDEDQRLQIPPKHEEFPVSTGQRPTLMKHRINDSIQPA
uniref:Uncharacterized protein n=1 Tax=Salvator merianae TaxID=96440 RepID=A0A8D0E448_SALMN